MKSIKSKLLFTLIPVIIIALAAVSWVNHNKAKDFLEETFEEKAFLQLENIKTIINDQLTLHIERLDSISKDPSIQSMDKDLQLKNIEQRVQGYSEYNMMFIADHKGDALTSDNKLFNISDRPYFQAIMKGQDSVVSDPVVSKASGESVIVIASAIKRDNQAIGVVGVTMPLKHLTTVANQVKVGETGYVSITQSDGLVIVHPKESLIMKEKIQDLGVAELASAHDNANNGLIGLEKYTFDGTERYIFYRNIPETNWGLYEIVPVKEATGQLSYLAMLSFVTAFVVIIFTIIIIIIFSSRLVKPIRVLSHMTTSVANGDLTIDINDHKGNDEVGTLGRNFGTMIKNMQDMLVKVKDVSNHVKTSSETLVSSSEETKRSAEQVAVTIADLANGTMDIANSVTNTTDQIGSMKETVGKISNYSNEIIETSRLSLKSTEKGQETSNLALQKMREMSATVNDTSIVIQGLDKKSKEIGDIVQMITNIAEQTNLLALNASIEAARAGDHGKGFAVVAEEVRKLANETTDSADKISALVTQTQHESKRAVESADIGKRVVDEGTATVKQAAAVFEEISKYVDEVLRKNENIHEEIRQLEDFSNHIATDMESIASVTEQASAGAQEVSAASQQQASSANVISDDAVRLSELAEQLKEVMSQFKIK